MPIVVVHELAHLRAALEAAEEAGVEVTLQGRFLPMGAMVFRAMVEEAAARVPGARFRAILDCGGDPGYALNALRHGLKAVRLEAPPELRDRVSDIATQLGAALADDKGPTLDLLDHPDPQAACRALLTDSRNEAV
ncbi:MAG: hypothetical protein H7841_16510 [Magnetospirillum sp. WYHS-4]